MGKGKFHLGREETKIGFLSPEVNGKMKALKYCENLRRRLEIQGYTEEVLNELALEEPVLVEIGCLMVDLSSLVATIFHPDPEDEFWRTNDTENHLLYILPEFCESEETMQFLPRIPELIHRAATALYGAYWRKKEIYKAEQGDPCSLFWTPDFNINRKISKSEYKTKLQKFNQILQALIICGANTSVVL
jgi:hypothetical protein